MLIKMKTSVRAILVSTAGMLSAGLVVPFGTITAQAATTTTLTWMLPEDPLIDSWGNAVVKGFEKAHPGVTIKLITPGSTAYGQKLLTLVASNQTPDVFTDWQNTGVYTITSHNLALNLTPYLKAAGDLTKIPASYKTEFSYQGEVVGVPWNSNPNFIVYNVDLFKKYKVPLPPTNWSDKSWNLTTVLNDAKKLSHNVSNPKTAVWGALFSPSSFAFGSFAWLWGADPFNDKGGPQDSSAYKGTPVTATYATTSGMVQSTTWLANLMNKYHVSPSMGQQTAMSALGNPFFTGKIGMDVVAGGWLERQAAVAKPTFKWAIAPFPYGPKGVDTAQREDNAFYVSRSSANPKLAAELLEYAIFGPGQQELITLAKDNPPLGNAADFKKWENEVFSIPGIDMSRTAFTNVFEGGLKKDIPDPSNLINDSTDFANAYTQVMAPVWNGQESATKGLQNLQNAWQQYLQP